jgi:hypothetical protein
MTARTLTGPTRHEQDHCERLIVRYRLADNSWQADRVLPIVWPQAEMKARRRLRELLDEGRDAEIIRRTPVI